jgi:hypothetical protein
MKTFTASASLLIMMFVSTASFASVVPVNRPPNQADQQRSAQTLARLGPGPIKGVSGKPKSFHIGTKNFGFAVTRTKGPDGSRQTTTRVALGAKLSRTATTTRLMGKGYEIWNRRNGRSVDKRTEIVGPLRTTERTDIYDVQKDPDAVHTRRTEIVRVDNGPGRGQITQATVTHKTNEVGGGPNVESARARDWYTTDKSARK